MTGPRGCRESGLVLVSRVSHRRSKRPHRRLSRAEAGEAGCAIQTARNLRIANVAKCDEARELLLRVSAMLGYVPSLPSFVSMA
jgi:hypothetical protein